MVDCVEVIEECVDVVTRGMMKCESNMRRNSGFHQAKSRRLCLHQGGLV